MTERSVKTARVFFALWPPASVAATIAARTRELNIVGRRVRPERLHLTLAFCGQYDCTAIERLTAFGNDLDIAAFDLVLDRVGHFRRVGVAWLGPARTPAPLARLAAALAPCSATPAEGQPFRPHVSVSRKSAPVAPAPLVPIVWPVDSFSLIASGRGGAPGTYRQLARWPLGTSPVPGSRV